jgi:hypothetical protein
VRDYTTSKKIRTIDEIVDNSKEEVEVVEDLDDKPEDSENK